MTDIAQSMDRIRALLDLDGYGDDVGPGEPEPSVADVGALDAVAFGWSSAPVSATVFAFDDGPSAMAAWTALHARADSWPHAAGSANGALLLWAVAGEATEQALDLIVDLCSSFAGEE